MTLNKYIDCLFAVFLTFLVGGAIALTVMGVVAVLGRVAQ